MMLFVDLAIRSAIVVLAGLAIRWLLRRQSAALRHAVLASSLLAASAVVPLSLLAPGWTVRIPAVAQAPAPQARTDALAGSAPESRAVSARPGARTPLRDRALAAALGLWIAGCAGSLLHLLAGIGHLLLIERRAVRVRRGPLADALAAVSRAQGVRRPIALLQTDMPDLVATWGLGRPRILLPAGAHAWSDERIQVALSHEVAHIRRRDWMVQVCADVLRAAYWFDPLLWMACARLRRDSEQACDDVVLGAGVAADRYAVHLLAVAREARGSRRPAAPALPMARRTTLERRISAMLNPGLDRSLPSPRLVFALAAPILALTVTVGVVRGAQTTPLPLTGTVFDPTGAVVPAVELTLSDDQQHALQSASADGSGRFVFEGVAPGRYVLEAAMPGFRRLRQDLELRRAGDWERAVTLQVGDVTETISVRSKRPAAPRPSASSAGAAPLRVGGNIRPPRKLKDVKPEYPASMREAGLEGMVPVLAVIGRDGNIHSLRALSAQVHPDFVASALEAVRQWRFEPTLLNGAPVEVAMTVTVEFSLSDQ